MVVLLPVAGVFQGGPAVGFWIRGHGVLLGLSGWGVPVSSLVMGRSAVCCPSGTCSQAVLTPTSWPPHLAAFGFSVSWVPVSVPPRYGAAPHISSELHPVSNFP